MNKKYYVKLSVSQREKLINLTSKGTASARKITRARILLLSDETNCEAMNCGKVANLLNIGVQTVVRIKRRFVEGGIENALLEKKRSGRPAKLNGFDEAKIIALATTDTPVGRQRWTLRLLEEKQVELALSENVSFSTIRKILKKTS